MAHSGIAQAVFPLPLRVGISFTILRWRLNLPLPAVDRVHERAHSALFKLALMAPTTRRGVVGGKQPACLPHGPS